jgi:predicted secreted protein
MAVVNGTAIVIDLDGVIIPCQTDSTSFPMEREMIEATCKDSVGSWKTYTPGDKSATFDAVINLDWTESNGIKDLFSKFDSGTLATFKWGDGTTTGESHFAGSCYVSSLTPDGPRNENATASFTATVNGAVTLVTNP